MSPRKTCLIFSRCSWTLYNFRLNLLEAVREHGHIPIAAGRDIEGYGARLEAEGIRFIPVPVSFSARNPLHDLRLLNAFMSICRKNRPDVVHNFTIKPVIYGSMAAKAAGVPRIINTVTGLGHIFVSHEKSMLRRMVELLYTLSLRLADRTFFQNSDDLALFRQHGLVRDGKWGLLPGSGVDTEFFTPRKAPSDDRFTFLMCSRIIREKGIIEFINAAEQILKTGARVRFQILGGIDTFNPSSLTEKEFTALLRPGIEWLGHHDDVRPYLAAADAVVLPSYREGTPRSLLEAAAMGKPMIATDVPGCREVVHHNENGLLVRVKDTEALARSFETMLNLKDELIDMGRKSRELAVSRFNENIVISRTLEAYGIQTQ